MVFVFPWWNVSSHPVSLTIGMDPEHVVELAYTAGESVRLRPSGDVDGYHWRWEAELPPRRKYELALVFTKGSDDEVLFRSIEVKGFRYGSESVALPAGSLGATEAPGLRVRQTGEGARILARAGARLALPVEFPSARPYHWVVNWTKATFSYLLVALILLWGLTSILRFPHGLQAFRRRPPPSEVALVVLTVILGALAHLHLVRHSIPVFSPGISDPYVVEAIMEAGQAKSGNPMAAADIAPAYPFFLSKLAPAADWSMSRVTLAQGILFSVSVLLLSLSLVRLVQGYYLAPVLLLVLLSPPAVWASRHIGPESLLAVTCLLSMAAFFFAMQREGILRWLGFILIAFFLSVAVCTASGGWLALIPPIGLLTGTLWWGFSVRGFEFWKLPVVWTTAAQVALVVLSAALSVMQFGNKPGRDAPLDDPSAAATVDQPVEALPVQARLAYRGRLSGIALFLPDTDFRGTPVRTDYRVHFGFPSSRQAESVRRSLSEIMRLSGQAVHVMEKRSDRRIVTYNQSLVSIYSWFYRILFFAALAGWLLGLSERKYLAAILILPYLGNILLRVALLDVGSHHIQVLDSLLWLSALAGLLCLSPKAMQKATDEGDRRTMAPIRPKRLLTRFRHVPKAPF